MEYIIINITMLVLIGVLFNEVKETREQIKEIERFLKGK